MRRHLGSARYIYIMAILALALFLAGVVWAATSLLPAINPLRLVVVGGIKPEKRLPNGGRTDLAVTLRLAPIHFFTDYRGVAMSIKPDRGRLNVTAGITNRGKRVVFVQHAAMLKWTVTVLDDRGRPLAGRRGSPVPAEGIDVPLRPGEQETKIFDLTGLSGLRPPGIFYVYSTVPVLAHPGPNDHLYTVFFRSPILRLTLAEGTPPIWKVVNSFPRYRPWQKFLPISPVAPPYPKHKLPTTGPIATLSEIATAVSVRDLKAVRKLCCDDLHATVPFYVALAAEAIAEEKCIAEAAGKFGVNPWPGFRPSPRVFSNILSRLNLPSLKVKRKTASVGVLWFHAGRFVALPLFRYYFHRVHGRWLLDFWATQESARSPSVRSYRLNVENSLREARAFESLTRGMAAGRFATVVDLKAAARQQFADVEDRFMLQSMKSNKRWMQAHARLIERLEKGERAARTVAGKPPETQP